MADYNSVEELFAAGITNMSVLVNNSAYDDNTYSALGADWLKFNGSIVSTVYVSGNTFFGFGSSVEHLKVNRRDTKMWYLYREEGTLYNYYRFIKFRWQGYSAYNQTSASYLLVYDVVLWENGCISLHMVNIPTSYYNGTFQLTAASALTYTQPTVAAPDVTFTPQDENHTVYTASYTAIDLPLPYDRKYLIRSENVLYTVIDNALYVIADATLSANLFQTYGLDRAPSGMLLVDLVDPELLFWQDSTDALPDLSLVVRGTPPLPQVCTSEPMDLTHESIAGINHATVDASEDVRFAISFDGGTTWKAFDGSTWFDTSDTVPGMLASTMNAITAEQWAEVVVLESYMVRFWLPNVTAYVASVVMHYINP